MPYLAINLPPGMAMNSTEYDSAGRYVNGNLIRFWRGKIRPVGGWTEVTADNVTITIEGIARKMWSWTDLIEANWLSLGTEKKLYAYDNQDWFDITPAVLPEGPSSGGQASGYGGGDYGMLEYGTARPFNYRVLAPANWSLDNWGQELIALANWQGIIHKWVPGTAAAVELVDSAVNTEVPQLNAYVFITDERHMVAVGAGRFVPGVDPDPGAWEADGRRIAWSSQEDYLAWTPTVTNTAGDLQLQTDSLAVCGTRFRGENLIWDTTSVHRMNYVGPPYVYGISKLADNAGIVGASAYATTNRFAIWVSRDAVMMYDGSVKELAPEVSEWYRDRRNPTYLSKTVVGHNPQFDEIWIFFVGNDESEPTVYMTWNYSENTFAKGQMPRSAWHDAGIFTRPFGVKPLPSEAGNTSILYQQEDGWLDGGASRVGSVWAKTSPIEIGAGDELVVCRRFVQDTRAPLRSDREFPSEVLQVEFEHRLAPEDEFTTEGPYAMDTMRGYTDVRFTGRQVSVYYRNVADEDFAIGKFRLEVLPGSQR